MTGRLSSAATTAVGAALARTTRRTRAFAALAITLIAVIGCDSSTSGRGTAATEGSGAGAAPGAGAEPSSGAGAGTGTGTSATSTLTPTSAPPPVPGPTAADGTNVSACADARCQVSLRAGTAIPVPPSTQVRDVRVTGVTGDRVTFTGHDLGNSSGGLCTGQCDSSSSNGAFTISLGVDSRATENGLSITVENIADGTAVLRIEPVT